MPGRVDGQKAARLTGHGRKHPREPSPKVFPDRLPEGQAVQVKVSRRRNHGQKVVPGLGRGGGVARLHPPPGEVLDQVLGQLFPVGDLMFVHGCSSLGWFGAGRWWPSVSKIRPARCRNCWL